MVAERISPDKSELQTTSRQTPGPGQGSSILMIGSCRGHAFIATDVLICADTLRGEDAIRTWLAERDIHVSSSSNERASADNDSTEGGGS